MIKLKKWGFKKALSLSLVGLITMGSIFSNTANTITSNAHNAYFVAISIDEANFRYMPTLEFEENAWTASNHSEADIGNFAEHTTGDWSVPIIDYTSEDLSEDDMKNLYEVVGEGDGDDGLIFTFPGVHSRGVLLEKVHANGTDEMLANRYISYVIGGLNDALSFCISVANAKEMNDMIFEMKNFSAELANASENKSGTITLNGVDFTISAGNPENTMDGLSKSDYVRISSGGEYIEVPFRVKKGYLDSDDRTGLSDKYIEALKDKNDTVYLDWKYTVLQGNFNADVKAVTYSSITEIVKPSSITLIITEFLNFTLSSIRILLGLYPIEDLMLNTGVRSSDYYYYGIMPNIWMNSANLLHLVSQIVALTLLGLSLIRMLYKRQLQTMNIGERVSLMDGFKNIILTAFLLGSFIPIFTAMVRINEVLVQLFGSSSNFSSYFGTSETMNGGAIGAIIVNIGFFILGCYYNFFYILRGITIAILYGIAPLCIFTLSLGGKYAQVYNSFMKELVSNIFIQTFHAICVAFFTSVTSTSNMKAMYSLTLFYSFIPLTTLIRQNIFGLSAGITDSAKGLLSVTKGVATGMIGGVMGAKMSGAGGSMSGAGGSMGGATPRTSPGGVNPAKSNIQEAMANRDVNSGAITSNGKILKDKDGNDMMKKNGVHNENLLKNVSGVDNKSNTSSKINTNPMSNNKKALNALANGAMAVGAGASAIGFSAIDDKVGTISSIRGASTFAGNFMKESNVGSSGLENTGIKDMYDGGEHMTNVYDAKADESGNMQFSDESLNNSDYGNNLKEMHDAFNSKGVYAEGGSKSHVRDEAIARYRSQGVKGVGTVGDNLAVTYDKSMTSNKNWTPRSVGEISKFNAPVKA